MDLISNPYFSIALIVLGFGFLIFVHELGHFLVAKMVGIKTTQFAIGFGHSLLTWRKGIGFRVGTTEPEYEKRIQEVYQSKQDEQTRPEEKTGGPTAEQADRIAAELGLGETEYRINYIPLGGYVKMLGQEDMDPTARSGDPRAFNNKSVSARFAVISAGVIMNLIFGMIFFTVAFMSGVMFPPAIVGSIAPDAPAAKVYAQGHEDDPAYLGLQPDDRITHIDGNEIGDMNDVMFATILAREDTPLALAIQRPGEPGELTYKIVPEVQKASGLLWIGVNPPLSLEIDKVSENSLAETAGLTKGMVISAVDGEPISSYAQYDKLVTAELGRKTVISFIDPKTNKTIDLDVEATPLMTQQDGSFPNLLGMTPPVMINSVNSKKPAAGSGIAYGDLIASINGNAWPDLDTFSNTIKEAPESGVEITVLRDGQEINLDPIKPRKKQIGVGIRYATDKPFVGRSLSDSMPPKIAPLVGGSRLLKINGQPLGSFGDLQRILAELPVGEEPIDLELTYELNLVGRPQETIRFPVSPDTLKQVSGAGWKAPLPDGMPPMTLQVPVVGDDPIEAAAIGFEKTHQFIMNTYLTLVRLAQNTVPPDKLSGPVGIVHQGTIIAERGWGYVLYFLGLISVNLAVINFLPIPITDGGLAIFLLIEKIKGSPVSVRVQTAATVMGLALLACVFLYVTYNDVLRLMGLS
jgi:regulator of sigma E protease